MFDKERFHCTYLKIPCTHGLACFVHSVMGTYAVRTSFPRPRLLNQSLLKYPKSLRHSPIAIDTILHPQNQFNSRRQFLCSATYCIGAVALSIVTRLVWEHTFQTQLFSCALPATPSIFYSLCAPEDTLELRTPLY